MDQVLFALSLTALVLGVAGLLFACLALWYHPDTRDHDAKVRANVNFPEAQIAGTVSHEAVKTHNQANRSTTVLPAGDLSQSFKVGSLPVSADLRPAAGTTIALDVHMSNVELEVVTAMAPQYFYSGPVVSQNGVKLTDIGDLFVPTYNNLGLNVSVSVGAANGQNLTIYLVGEALKVTVADLWIYGVTVTSETTELPIYFSLLPTWENGLLEKPISTKPVSVKFNDNHRMHVTFLHPENNG